MADERAAFRIAYVVDDINKVLTSMDKVEKRAKSAKKELETVGTGKTRAVSADRGVETQIKAEKRRQQEILKSKQAQAGFLDLAGTVGPILKKATDVGSRGFSVLQENVQKTQGFLNALTGNAAKLSALKIPQFTRKKDAESIERLAWQYTNLRKVVYQTEKGKFITAIIGTPRDQEQLGRFVVALKETHKAALQLTKIPVTEQQFIDLNVVPIIKKVKEELLQLGSGFEQVKQGQASLNEAKGVKAFTTLSRQAKKFGIDLSAITNRFITLRENLNRIRGVQVLDKKSLSLLKNSAEELNKLERSWKNLRVSVVKDKDGLLFRGLIGDSKNLKNFKNVIVAYERFGKLKILPRGALGKEVQKSFDILPGRIITIRKETDLWGKELKGVQRVTQQVFVEQKGLTSKYLPKVAHTWRQGKLEAQAYHEVQKQVKNVLNKVKNDFKDVATRAADLSAGKKALKDLGVEYKNQINVIRKLRKESQKSGAISSDRILKEEAKLRELRKAIKNLSGEYKRHGKILGTTTRDFNIYGQSIDEAIVRVFKYRIALNLLMRTQMQLSEGYRTLIRLQDKLAQIKIVLPKASDINLVRQSFFDLAKEFGTGIEQVGDAFKIFAQQGLGVSEALDLTRASLLAVNTAGLEASKATEAITAAFRNFEISTEDATIIVDKFLSVQAKFAVTAKDLAESLQKAAPVARIFGDSIDYVLGATAGVVEVSRRAGRQVGTAFRTIFGRIGRPAAVEALEQVGVAVFKASGEFRAIQSILTDLSTVWDRLNESEQRMVSETLAGLRRIQDFSALMQNFDRVLEATTVSMYAFGSASAANEEIMSTLSRQFKILQTQVTEVTQRTFAAGLEPILRGTTSTLGAFTEALKAIPPQLTAAAGGMTAFFLSTKLLQAFRLKEGAVVGQIAQALSIPNLERVLGNWNTTWNELFLEPIRDRNFKRFGSSITKYVTTPLKGAANSFASFAKVAIIPMVKWAAIIGIFVAALSRLWKAGSNVGDTLEDIVRKSGSFAKEIEKALTPQKETIKVVQELGKEYGNFIEKLKILSKEQAPKVRKLLEADPQDFKLIAQLNKEVTEAGFVQFGLRDKIKKKLDEQGKTEEKIGALQRQRLEDTESLAELQRLIALALGEHYNRMKTISDAIERMKESTKAALDEWVQFERKGIIRRTLGNVWNFLLDKPPGATTDIFEAFGIDAGSKFAESYVQAAQREIKQRSIAEFLDFEVKGFKDIFKLVGFGFGSRGLVSTAERFNIQLNQALLASQKILELQLAGTKGLAEYILIQQGVLDNYQSIEARNLKILEVTKQLTAYEERMKELLKPQIEAYKYLADYQKGITREASIAISSFNQIVEFLTKGATKAADIVTNFKKATVSAPALARVAEKFGELDTSPALKQLEAMKTLFEEAGLISVDLTLELQKQQGILNTVNALTKKVSDSSSLAHKLAILRSEATKEEVVDTEKLRDVNTDVVSAVQKSSQEMLDFAQTTVTNASKFDELKKDVDAVNKLVAILKETGRDIFKDLKPIDIDALLNAIKSGKTELDQFFIDFFPLEELQKAFEELPEILDRRFKEVARDIAREATIASANVRASFLKNTGVFEKQGEILAQTAQQQEKLNRYSGIEGLIRQDLVHQLRLEIQTVKERIEREEYLNSLIQKQQLLVERTKKALEIVASVSTKAVKEELTFRQQNLELINKIAILQSRIGKEEGIEQTLRIAEEELKLRRSIYTLELAASEIDQRRLKIQESLASSLQVGAESLFSNLENLQKEEEIRWNIKQLEEDILRARKSGEPTADLLNQLREARDELEKISFKGILRTAVGDFARTLAEAFRSRLIENLSKDLADLFMRKITFAEEVEFALVRGGRKFVNQLSSEFDTVINEFQKIPLDSKILSSSQESAKLFYNAIKEASIIGSKYYSQSISGGKGFTLPAGFQSTLQMRGPRASFGGLRVPTTFDQIQQRKELNATLGLNNILEDVLAEERNISDNTSKFDFSDLGKQLALLGSGILGSAFGGGGAGAQTGATFGSLALGSIFLNLIPGGGIIGGLLGGLIGGGVGGAFDDKWTPPIVDNTKALSDLNKTLENTNKLLQLQAQLINLPQNFVLPPSTRGGFIPPSGGDNFVFAPQINAGGANAGELATSLVNEFDQYRNQIRRSNYRPSRWNQ